ncbi:MAG: tRNA (guanine(46)-N(7))-methyltransferase TrmB, partial [Desulfatiglandales bacterium]
MDGPLCVEIGFGQGHYIANRAKREPKTLFLGIENSWIPLKMCLRKIGQLGLKNLRLLLCDVRDALLRLFEERSIDEIICLFPCPWPKERHKKRRLFSSAFMRLMNSRLKDTGQATVVTDHLQFKEWVRENAKEGGFLID